MKNHHVMTGFLVAALCGCLCAEERVVEVAPGDTVTIRVVVELKQPPVTPPPVDPPPVDTPPTPPVDPPKPPKNPLTLTVPTDGTLAECCKRIAPNGTITVAAGVHRTRSADLNTAGVTIKGLPGATLSPAADYGDGALIVVNQAGCRLEGLTIDMEFLNRRKAIRGEKRADRLLVIGCEVRNVAWHAIDIDGADCAVENCQIHHILWKNLATSNKMFRDDAHGVTTLTAQRLAIRNCQIWNCSGDCVQGDRGKWQDLLIEGCDLFWEPLSADTGGFPAGYMMGENAFDSKTASADWQRATIRNCRIWGFGGEKRALVSVEAINAKERCDLLVEGCQISGVVACRLALYRDGKGLRATIRNCRIVDSVIAFRVEDQNQGNPATNKPPLPSPITIEGCDVSVADRPGEPQHAKKAHFLFVDLNAGDPLGKTGFGPGASVTGTTFRGGEICIQRGDVPAIRDWLLSPASGNSVVE